MRFMHLICHQDIPGLDWLCLHVQMKTCHPKYHMSKICVYNVYILIFSYIYMCVCVCVCMYTKHICITVYVHHFCGIYIILHLRPINWWCRKLTRLDRPAPLQGRHGRGTIRWQLMIQGFYNILIPINLWFGRCCNVSSRAFWQVRWESWKNVHYSAKPSEEAVAWVFRLAFHSAPKSFLTLCFVVPYIYIYVYIYIYICLYIYICMFKYIPASPKVK